MRRRSTSTTVARDDLRTLSGVGRTLQSDGRTLVNRGPRPPRDPVTVEPSAEVTGREELCEAAASTPSDASVTMQAGEDIYMLLVRDMGSIPDASKASGIKIISCMEVNDTNPLNNLNLP